jgi:hypothetical protein
MCHYFLLSHSHTSSLQRALTIPSPPADGVCMQTLDAPHVSDGMSRACEVNKKSAPLSPPTAPGGEI